MLKKLQQIDGTDGLATTYGGGDYTVTVWDDMDGGFELVFCRSSTSIPHERIAVSPGGLETEMRKWQPDLRRWRKVEYEV
jgi:hypothetical protein